MKASDSVSREDTRLETLVSTYENKKISKLCSRPGTVVAHIAPMLAGPEKLVRGFETADLLRPVDEGELYKLNIAKAMGLLMYRLFHARSRAGSFSAVGILEPELHVGMDGSRAWRLAARYAILMSEECNLGRLSRIVSAGGEHSIAGTMCQAPENCCAWGCLASKPYGERARDIFSPRKGAYVRKTPLQGKASKQFERWSSEHPVETRLFRF